MSLKSILYNVFTVEKCYKAIAKMVNDEISIQNLTLNHYIETDIQKNLILDLEEYNGWVLQWIDDVRFHMQAAGTSTDDNEIIQVMSECLYNVNAGQQILDKFLLNKYRNNKKFVTCYY